MIAASEPPAIHLPCLQASRARQGSEKYPPPCERVDQFYPQSLPPLATTKKVHGRGARGLKDFSTHQEIPPQTLCSTRPAIRCTSTSSRARRPQWPKTMRSVLWRRRSGVSGLLFFLKASASAPPRVRVRQRSRSSVVAAAPPRA